MRENPPHAAVFQRVSRGLATPRPKKSQFSTVFLRFRPSRAASAPAGRGPTALFSARFASIRPVAASVDTTRSCSPAREKAAPCRAARTRRARPGRGRTTRFRGCRGAGRATDRASPGWSSSPASIHRSARSDWCRVPAGPCSDLPRARPDDRRGVGRRRRTTARASPSRWAGFRRGCVYGAGTSLGGVHLRPWRTTTSDGRFHRRSGRWASERRSAGRSPSGGGARLRVGAQGLGRRGWPGVGRRVRRGIRKAGRGRERGRGWRGRFPGVWWGRRRAGCSR